MALPACCLCICIHLERIASVRQVCTAHSDKIRRMIFDAALCWGIPMVYMALRTCISLFIDLWIHLLHRLYRSRPPIWHHRRLWLSPHGLRVPSRCLLDLGSAFDCFLCDSWFFRYVKLILENAPTNVTRSSYGITALFPSPVDVRKAPSKFQFRFEYRTLFSPHGHGDRWDDLGFACDQFKYVVLLSTWLATVDQLAECS